jgi:hypothetical protein
VCDGPERLEDVVRQATASATRQDSKRSCWIRNGMIDVLVQALIWNTQVSLARILAIHSAVLTFP